MSEKLSSLTPFEIELCARPSIHYSDRAYLEDLSKIVAIDDLMQEVEFHDRGDDGLAYALSDTQRSQYQLAKDIGFFFSRSGILPFGETFDYSVMTLEKDSPEYRTRADRIVSNGLIDWEEFVFEFSESGTLYVATTPEIRGNLGLVVLNDVDLLDESGCVPENIKSLTERLRRMEGHDLPAEKLYSMMLDAFVYQE